MKYFLLLVTVLFCLSVEAQTKKEVKESIKHCPVNEFQISIIHDIEVKIEALTKERSKAIELVTGVRIEDIEKLEFGNGEFIVTIKRKD